MSLALILDAYLLESDEEAGGEGDDATREEEKVNCKIEDPDGDELVPLESTLIPLQDEEIDFTNVSSEPTQIFGDSKANILPEQDTPSFQDNGIENRIVVNSRNDFEGASNSRNDDIMESEEMFDDRMPVPESVAGSEVNNESSHLSSYVQKEEPLKCPYCLGIYFGTDELIQHLATHPKGKKLEGEGIVKVKETNSVDQSRVSQIDQRNKKATHNRNNNFKCSKCDSIFTTPRDLQKHMALHTDTGRPWKCMKCGCGFTTLSHLRRHENRLHGRKGVGSLRNSSRPRHRPLPLPDNKVSVSPNGIPKIKDEKETKKIKIGKCDLCNLVFDRQPRLIRHKMTIHTESANRPWKCLECRSFFTTKQHLRLHENLRHGKKESKCTICNITFKNQSGLEDHVKIHDEVGRPWRCGSCRSFFLTKNQLRHHENLRHGRKEHKCPVCNKIFFGESELEYHNKLHEETGRPWRCSPCNYFFATLASLHSHESRAHGRMITQPFTHKCLICRITFISLHKLRRHIKVHKDGADKHWKCSQCHSFFRALHSLSIHENRVHGRKAGKTETNSFGAHQQTGGQPLNCPLCNKQFSTKWGVVRHLINVHGQSRSTAHSTLNDSSYNYKGGASTKWRDLLHKLRPCKLVLTRCDDLISSYGKSTIKTEGDEDYEDHEVFGKLINIKVELGENDRKKENSKKGSDNEKPGQNVFRCPFCLEEFMESHLLIAHLPIHTVEAGKQNCKTEEVLDQKVLPMIHESSGSSLLNPTKPKPSSRIKPFKCDQCNYSCLLSRGLQYHMRQHSESGRPFKCSKCNYSFTTFKSLRIHEGRFHKGSKLLHTPTPMHKCQQCNYSSKAIAHLMQHLELHKEEGRPFKCVRCNLTFTTFKSLRIHEGRFHKGSKSLQIDVAPTGAGCFDKGSKSLHNAPTRRHKCKHCSYSSPMLQRLRIHLQHHKEKGRPFKCVRCCFTFATFQSLRTHEGRFHKGSKSLQNIGASALHKCRRCKYSTRILPDWENHMASHKKILRKPFKCSLCGSLFHNFKELRIHTRRLHMNEKIQ